MRRKALVGLLVGVDPGRMAVAEGSPGAGIPDPEAGNLDPEEEGNLDLEEDNLDLVEEDSLGLGADHCSHSMSRTVSGRQGQHHRGRRRASHEEGHSESLCNIRIWIATVCTKACLPVGFLSSSSSSSFIFFLRKSMMKGCEETTNGQVLARREGMKRKFEVCRVSGVEEGFKAKESGHCWIPAGRLMAASGHA